MTRDQAQDLIRLWREMGDPTSLRRAERLEVALAHESTSSTLGSGAPRCKKEPVDLWVLVGAM